jgi:hypothetical protein
LELEVAESDFVAAGHVEAELSRACLVPGTASRAASMAVMTLLLLFAVAM